MARKLKQPNPLAYGANQPFDTPFPDPIVSTRAPTTDDIGFDIGQTWINRTTDQAWTMTNPGVWALSSPGASDVDTINGLSPVAGNIVIAGGTNLGVVNAGNTVTLNLDAAIDVATSVTSPLFTSGAGVDTAIMAPAGQDIIVHGTVKQIDAEFVTRSGVDVTFRSSPILQSTATTGAAPSGATGDTNIMMFQEGFVLEQFIKGAGQTIIAPRMDADGLLISLDQVATEGVEFNPGNRNNAPMTFTIGTDSAFFAECTYTVADVSGCEPMYFGFRKVQANDADYTNYTDFVGYGLNNLVAGGDAVIATNLNGAGINTTDTNDAWADAGTHTLTVKVSDAGVVTFLFDGVAPTATQAYTFDNGDVVEFWYTHVFGAALPGNINWVDFKCGYQP